MADRIKSAVEPEPRDDRGRMRPPAGDVQSDTALKTRVRGLREGRKSLGSSAHVPDVWRHALL